MNNKIPAGYAVAAMWFILQVLLLGSCQNQPSDTQTAQTGVVEKKTENYANGKTSRTYRRVDGKIEGPMVDYYPDGKLKAERNFVGGQQVGKTILYYPDGQVKEVQYYENGLKNGGDTMFYANGKPQFAVTFKDDKKNGYLRKWLENDSLIYEAKFELDSLREVNGRPVGQQ